MMEPPTGRGRRWHIVYCFFFFHHYYYDCYDYYYYYNYCNEDSATIAASKLRENNGFAAFHMPPLCQRKLNSL